MKLNLILLPQLLRTITRLS